MAHQYSVAVRNARLDAIETAIGASPVLRFRTGAPPANADAARTGTVLATLNLPSDWMAAASGGVKAMSGTWQDLSADAAGTIGHYEIMNNGLTACGIQGTVTATGGGGDMTVDNVVVAVAQQINVTGYSITGGNA